ncbi:hypothetical protein CTAYLR_000129 [Chrysophaeum taylorii]|uniref:Methyltransferase FkbM domain-containing protein n=1 Tax=Chrysophaeum taylorii TaxID=2483200 RepID=A0AAD7UI26_9STRA|nr:hypothetical protein CTAYLR_000129 [Chrysophaeum taylorii]
MIVAELMAWSEPGGTYVEIGAYDGLRYSNTLYLATCLRWGGVLVEGGYTNFRLLEANVKIGRSGGVAFYGAVCAPPDETVRFVQSANIGGAVDALLPGRRNLSKHEDVPCRPMEFYLQNLTHVDFFSLDVEGGELLVLETIDFSALTIDVFLVELATNPRFLAKNWRVRRFLSNLDYVDRRLFVVAGVTGMGAPALAVVANPFEEISAASRTELEAGVPVLDIDAALALVKRKEIVSVTFLTAKGDTALALLADGSKVYILEPETATTSRGPFTLVSKLRDARVPYKFTAFDLTGFAASKKLREEGNFRAQ